MAPNRDASSLVELVLRGRRYIRERYGKPGSEWRYTDAGKLALRPPDES